MQTDSGKARGKCFIPAEIYKATSTNAVEDIPDVLLSVWEKMSVDFCDALIISLYKNDGNKADWKRQRHLNPFHPWKDLGINHLQHS